MSELIEASLALNYLLRSCSMLLQMLSNVITKNIWVVDFGIVFPVPWINYVWYVVCKWTSHSNHLESAVWLIKQCKYYIYRMEGCCARSKYQWQRQVFTSHIVLDVITWYRFLAQHTWIQDVGHWNVYAQILRVCIYQVRNQFVLYSCIPTPCIADLFRLYIPTEQNI